MPTERSQYAVRQLEDGSGYVIDETMPGNPPRQMVGVYVSEAFADEAIDEFRRQAWHRGKPRD
jgi:hypothetical protein